MLQCSKIVSKQSRCKEYEICKNVNKYGRQSALAKITRGVMESMDRKKLAVALVVGMLVLGMLGTVAGASGVSGKLTIWSWGAGGEKEAREAAVNAFIKAYPQLDVEHSVIPTADSVGTRNKPPPIPLALRRTLCRCLLITTDC